MPIVHTNTIRDMNYNYGKNINPTDDTVKPIHLALEASKRQEKSLAYEMSQMGDPRIPNKESHNDDAIEALQIKLQESNKSNRTLSDELRKVRGMLSLPEDELISMPSLDMEVRDLRRQMNDMRTSYEKKLREGERNLQEFKRRMKDRCHRNKETISELSCYKENADSAMLEGDNLLAEKDRIIIKVKARLKKVKDEVAVHVEHLESVKEVNKTLERKNAEYENNEMKTKKAEEILRNTIQELNKQQILSEENHETFKEKSEEELHETKTLLKETVALLDLQSKETENLQERIVYLQRDNDRKSLHLKAAKIANDSNQEQFDNAIIEKNKMLLNLSEKIEQLETLQSGTTSMIRGDFASSETKASMTDKAVSKDLNNHLSELENFKDALADQCGIEYITLEKILTLLSQTISQVSSLESQIASSSVQLREAVMDYSELQLRYLHGHQEHEKTISAMRRVLYDLNEEKDVHIVRAEAVIDELNEENNALDAENAILNNENTMLNAKASMFSMQQQSYGDDLSETVSLKDSPSEQDTEQINELNKMRENFEESLRREQALLIEISHMKESERVRKSAELHYISGDDDDDDKEDSLSLSGIERDSTDNCLDECTSVTVNPSEMNAVDNVVSIQDMKVAIRSFKSNIITLDEKLKKKEESLENAKKIIASLESANQEFVASTNQSLRTQEDEIMSLKFASAANTRKNELLQLELERLQSVTSSHDTKECAPLVNANDKNSNEARIICGALSETMNMSICQMHDGAVECRTAEPSLEQEVNCLRNKLEELKENAQDANHLRIQLEEKEIKLSSLQDICTQQRLEREELMKECELLSQAKESKLLSCQDEVKSLKTKCDNYHKRIFDLEKEVEELHLEKKESVNSIKSSDPSNMRELVLLETLEESEKESIMLKENIEGIGKKKDAICKELAQCNHNLNCAKMIIASLEKASDNRIVMLKNQLTESRKAVFELTQKSTDLDETMENMRSTIKHLRRELQEEKDEEKKKENRRKNSTKCQWVEGCFGKNFFLSDREADPVVIITTKEDTGESSVRTSASSLSWGDFEDGDGASPNCD